MPETTMPFGIPRRPGRPLTAGEASMARLVFKDALDVSAPRVHASPFLPLGLQPRMTAMAPDGDVHFHPDAFREDFSQASDAEKHWFMHELAHVWQWQLGYPVMARGAVRIGLSYDYLLGQGKLLCDFDMEAQAEILADWHSLVHLGIPCSRQANRLRGMDCSLHESALRDFLRWPSDRGNLPGGPSRSRRVQR